MTNLYLKPFFFSFLAACAFVPFIRWAAVKFWKWPWRSRDVHQRNVPRIGGAALILVFWLIVFLDQNLVVDKPLFGVLIASALILIFGTWDDFKEINPKIQFAIQIFLAIIIIGAGVSVDYITNPFGGTLRLDAWRITLFNQQFSVLGSLLIAAWLVLMMNVVNWLDGLDGLASGVSLIGFLSIFFLSVSELVNQPPIGILAVILVGALIGFLIFNFPRKKGSLIFLGTSGSMFLGFMLGSLSIFSGSKMATAFLVLGVAILDAFWVIWQRLKSRVPIYEGDQRHLHHQLLRSGLTKRQILFLYLFICAVFGSLALITGTKGKVIAFLGLCAIMVLIIYVCNYKNRRQAI